MYKRYADKKIFLIVLLFLWGQLAAQEMVVPIDLQLALFSRVLAFDRNLKGRMGDEIVIGIVYQDKVRSSLQAKEAIFQNHGSCTTEAIADISTVCVGIELSEEDDLSRAIQSNHVDILYVTPLRSFDIKKLTRIGRANHLLTLTGVPEYVESGLSVGIGIKGGKPQIIINLPVAKAEGVDFSSQLLNLAKVIG